MPEFGVHLARVAVGCPIAIQPRIEIGDPYFPCGLLNDDQLRDRLRRIPLRDHEIEGILASLNREPWAHVLRFPADHWPEIWPNAESFREFWTSEEGPGDGSTAEGWIHLFGPLTLIGNMILEKKTQGWEMLGGIYLTDYPPGRPLVAHAILVPRPRGEDAERFRRPDLGR